jgi:endonuclease VIII
VPEGNEIHRWAERHAAAFAGKVVRVDGPQGRFKDSDVIDGRKLRKVMTAGKHLGYDFGEDRILHVHLGLQGDFTEGSGPLPSVKGALRLRMWNEAALKKPAAGESRRHRWYSEDDGTDNIEPKKIAWVELRGPMDCSVYSNEKWKELVSWLGPDALNGDSPEKALTKIGRSSKPIGALLMDQSVMAGVGNILRAELLYRARVSPFIAGKEVVEEKVRAMWEDLVPLMRAAMIDRRIVTTLEPDRPSFKEMAGNLQGDGDEAGRVLKEETHYVYRRHGKECFVCGTKIRRQEMEGRNLYWCPTCQEGKQKRGNLR